MTTLDAKELHAGFIALQQRWAGRSITENDRTITAIITAGIEQADRIIESKIPDSGNATLVALQQKFLIALRHEFLHISQLVDGGGVDMESAQAMRNVHSQDIAALWQQYQAARQ
jgi:hypothetical protein